MTSDEWINELMDKIRQNPNIKATEIGWESFEETLEEAKQDIKQKLQEAQNNCNVEDDQPKRRGGKR